MERFANLIPADLVAQQPCEPRDAARLLVCAADGRVTHAGVRDLPRWLRPGDCLVVNRTRVLAVRLTGHRASGGRVRLLLLPPAAIGQPDDAPWECYAEARGRLVPGEALALADGTVCVLAESRGGGRWRCDADPHALARLCATHGRAPLPPYIRRPATDDPDAAADRDRYQTVFAAESGAVAAPTAGLHFTPALCDAVRAAGAQFAEITLHVGPGTFAPPRAPGVGGPEPERCHVDAATVDACAAARAAGGRVIAVGTTVTRALEWAAQPTGTLAPRSGSADLAIAPGHAFRAIDALWTNFHQPGSGPLMLAAAFAGVDRLFAAYQAAVAERYRFWSYGDAMLIW